MRHFVIVGLVLVAAGAGTNMALAKDADCVEKTGEVQLRACTKIIQTKQVFGKRISKKDLAIAYYNRGVAYGKKGQYDRAIADYDQAIKLNPKDTEAYYNRGNTYYQKGQFDRAFADYDQAIKLNPKDADAYYNRGWAYGDKGQFDRAIADYDQAIKLNPKVADAYYNRGWAYKNKGERDKAIADYRKALEIDPSYELAKNNLKVLGVEA